LKEKRKITAELNHLLWETLELLKPFESPNICFFGSENIYNKLPGLAFRFKNAVSQDYVFLQDTLNSFKGIEKWVCYKPEVTVLPTKNYFIEVEATLKLRKEHKNEVDLQRGETKELIDRILEDYPLVCRHLEVEIQRTTEAFRKSG